MEGYQLYNLEPTSQSVQIIVTSKLHNFTILSILILSILIIIILILIITMTSTLCRTTSSTVLDQVAGQDNPDNDFDLTRPPELQGPN